MLAPVDRCPCCGTRLVLAESATWHRSLNLIETLYGSLTLTQTKGRIFDIIWRARPHGVPMERLVTAVWPGADGPPEYARGDIRVHCSKLRKMLVPLGILLLPVEKGGIGYRFAVLLPEEATDAAQRIKARYGWPK